MATGHPTPPTSSLPPLRGLTTSTLAQISAAIDNLHALYRPTALTALPQPKALPKHPVHDTSVPDSGYASAEGEDDSDDECDDEEDAFDIDVLRSDSFEREFAIRWLTGFTARSDSWVYAPGCSEDESDARAALVDAAASLLGSFSGEDEEEAVTRTFTFPTSPRSSGVGAIHVELNDAALLTDDHTSVGLQSWGSAIRLAERMCLDPGAFGLASGQRILELGAGTGLLSIAAAKLLAHPSSAGAQVVATDYHPHVLDNLQANVSTNFPSSPSPHSFVEVLPLDWQNPVFQGALAEKFDLILAADVVYHPDHARWIKACVEHLLQPDGLFWLIIPLRPTGRHEGMSDTVDAIFPHGPSGKSDTQELVILGMEEMRKQDGVGRADEGGYKLYKIGWA
uniref:Laccase-2 (Diphenol oxidase 2) (Urishiol oxidase 2)) n=1 Tax=Ganoderma boninense TaxID=34458 RepID=A0A5K1K5M9_9APHY|nr:Laccase-2 (EC (Benzenediol:oxygen oxidoreductase 2) (Diphenol oxidase 2) (Urishiol oxidase 2) [Ganoderma boninense]